MLKKREGISTSLGCVDARLFTFSTEEFSDVVLVRHALRDVQDHLVQDRLIVVEVLIEFLVVDEIAHVNDAHQINGRAVFGEAGDRGLELGGFTIGVS